MFCLLKGPFLKLPRFISLFKWLKNVEHHQLSIHLFIRKILSAMVCLSPLLPNLRLPFGEDVLQPDDICHFRPYSASVMSAVLFKDIYN